MPSLENLFWKKVFTQFVLSLVICAYRSNTSQTVGIEIKNNIKSFEKSVFTFVMVMFYRKRLLFL